MSDPWYYEWCELIVKYIRDRYGREGTVEQIINEPIGKIRNWHEDALAYYGMKNRFLTFEQVPEELRVEGTWIDIRGKGVLTQYLRRNGTWVEVSSIPDSLYK